MEGKSGETLRYSAEFYTLTFPDDRPYVYLDDAGGRLADLFVPSGIHPLHGRDDTTRIGPWEVVVQGRETVFSLRAASSVWAAKIYRFRCTPTRLVYEMAVEGNGRLAEVTPFGGYCSARPRWGSGSFLSGHAFQRGFNPEPNAENIGLFDPAAGAVIDLTGAPLPGKRHWFFTPAPFCFAFETASGWLGLGVEAAPGMHCFTEYRYHGQEGFYLSLSYEGQTEVNGSFDLPAIGIDFGSDRYEVLESHVAALRAAGNAPVPAKGQPEWWRRPMFCGWGAQCHRAARDHGYRASGPEDADHRAFLATMPYAADYACQPVYEEFLSELESQGLRPGTIVIDDKWQLRYGTNEVDPVKWPHLSKFVQRRHAAGQRVLLWLKAWDREGVPDAECVRNASGDPLTVDPTNPVYRQRLQESVQRMLSPSGYGADGFKIDFTHRIPSGPGLQRYGDAWGLELMRVYLELIHDEAKRVKPDALIVAHTPHPYLADVVDMIRLNDMLDLTALDDPEAGRDIGRIMRDRARVARIACPEAPIDTDNWPVRDRAAWREYIAIQTQIGVPSLYYTLYIDLTQEPLETEDFQLIREAWQCCPPS
jgi:hypothetical protein